MLIEFLSKSNILKCRGIDSHFPEYSTVTREYEDRGSTVVRVLCYKSEGRWFDPSWCQWIFLLT